MSGMQTLVSIPAWNKATARYEDVWIDASQVSAVGRDRGTFIDCGKSTFHTSLTVDEVMALLEQVNA